MLTEIYIEALLVDEELADQARLFAIACARFVRDFIYAFDSDNEICRDVVFPNGSPGFSIGIIEIKIVRSMDFVHSCLVKREPLAQTEKIA